MADDRVPETSLPALLRLLGPAWRCLTGLIALALIAGGSVSVFVVSNGVGSAGLLVLGAFFSVVAMTGRVPRIKFGDNELVPEAYVAGADDLNRIVHLQLTTLLGQSPHTDSSTGASAAARSREGGEEPAEPIHVADDVGRSSPSAIGLSSEQVLEVLDQSVKRLNSALAEAEIARARPGAFSGEGSLAVRVATERGWQPMQPPRPRDLPQLLTTKEGKTVLRGRDWEFDVSTGDLRLLQDHPGN